MAEEKKAEQAEEKKEPNSADKIKPIYIVWGIVAILLMWLASFLLYR